MEVTFTLMVIRMHPTATQLFHASSDRQQIALYSHPLFYHLACTDGRPTVENVWTFPGKLSLVEKTKVLFYTIGLEFCS